MTPQDFIAIAERAGLTFFMTGDLDAGVADHAEVVEALTKALTEMTAPPEPTSVRDAVLGMRDTFLQLVAAYNHVHCFKDARDAQVMAIALHEFEDTHNITTLAWPLHPITDDDGPGLMSIEGRPLSGEDL